MIRLRSYAATARQALRFASALARRATADKSLVRSGARLGFAAASTLAFIVTAGSTSLLACPVCFGAEETSMIDGTKLGIMVMLGITFAVQGAFLGFFLYLRRRAKRIAEIDLDTEWSDLQGASRTS